MVIILGIGYVTSRNTVIESALSEAVYLESLLDHISTVV
jgi:hypothetical protein